MATIPTAPPNPEVTAREFLEDFPLYRQWNGTLGAPDTISRDCRHCAKETTWKQQGNYLSSTMSSFKLLQYQCVHCGKDSVNFLIAVLYHGAALKAGQYPMHTARVPNSVATRLGTSADFYRKAITSRNEGYGLAAVAYFRRVVEDKTNELIDVVADAAATYSVPAIEVDKIRAAKKEKAYEDKLKIAAQAIPDVLKPDGANPFQAMYDILSVGIHTQSEEECLQIADDTREIFDYLFDRLRTETTERATFVSKVKAIAGKRGTFKSG